MEIATDALDFDFVDVADLQDYQKPADTCFFQDFNEPLQTGTCIIIRGKVRRDCTRFAINLLWHRGPKSDVAFHFNPRLALRYIVRNSRINNSWGDEETTSIEKFNLQRNKIFEIQIVAADREFYVSLDGRHICAYVFRIPLEKINRITVEGLVDIQNVQHKEVDNYPATAVEVPYVVPVGDGADGAGAEGDRANKNLVVPLTATLPNGFKQGWQLEILGRVKILPSAFYINLQQGSSLWPHPIIPLHLNPRFYTSYGNHLFVRNSWMNGEWGTEERTPGFQFTPGQEFHLAIRKNSNHFSVWVDGTLAGEFQFRTPVDDIDAVYIHGDIHVYSIYMKDHIDDKYFSKNKEEVSKSL